MKFLLDMAFQFSYSSPCYMMHIIRFVTIDILMLSSSFIIAFSRRGICYLNSLMLQFNSSNQLIIMIRRILGNNTKYLFGTEALNIRISDKDPLTKERIDKHLDRYGHLLRAFLLKRRINRSEIWPKIHIIDHVTTQELPHLQYQRLFSMKKSMKDEVMTAISKNDPTKINSAFIISIFCEDYFKEMIDEYIGKVLVCGKCPSNEQEYNLVQAQVKNLYHMFYYGQKTTPLEREIQQAYLSSKQFKYMRSQYQKKIKKTDYDSCIWGEKDQRMLEEKVNWQVTDTNLTDANYRTYFHPLQLQNRAENRLKYEKLQSNWTFFDNLKFNWFTRKYYDPTSRKYFEWVEQKLFIRIMNHLKSLQFTTCLNIPHDYMIEAQIIQIHFWLVIDRLKKIGTVGALLLAQRLTFTLNLQTVKSSRSVNVKKSNILQASLERMLETNNVILELHFNRSEITKDNHYKSIDALVWSVAFAQKIHRYADEVYLFSEYLIKNFQHMQRHSYSDLVNGIIQFDPYLVDNRYREKIQKINPPLPADEFQRQFNSNSDKKDYYYSKVQRQLQEVMPQQRQFQPSTINTKFSFAQFIQPLRNIQIKYLTLNTMDHFNKMEQKKKQNEQLDKKATWKSQKDELKQVNQDFSSIQSIKAQRKRKNAKQSDNK